MEFAVDVLSNDLDSHSIGNHSIGRIGSYARQNAYRYLGAGVAEQILELWPYLLSRLWVELDIVLIIAKTESGSDNVDEIEDSMARKRVM